MKRVATLMLGWAAVWIAGCAPGARFLWVPQVLNAERSWNLERQKLLAHRIEDLGSEDPEVSGRAEEELVGMEEEAHEALLAAAQNRPLPHAARAMRVYARTGNAQGILDIRRSLYGEGRRQAALALTGLVDPSHAPQMRAWYGEEPVADIRRAILRSFCVWGSRRHLSLLQKAFRDPDEGVAEEAVEGLIFLRAADPLQRQWPAADAAGRVRILRALGRMRAGSDLVVRAFSDPSTEIRIAAAGAAGPQQKKELVALLEDPSWSVFLAASEALERLTGQSVAAEGNDPDQIRREAVTRWKQIVGS